MPHSYSQDTETTLYYLQSRYYDPELGRFINSDIAVSTGQGLIGVNTFAYCGNNPVSRSDNGGAAWETIWDILSLGSSILDVAMNPDDPWAWIGLVGDLIDVAVPFVGGLGEATRAVNATLNVTEALDDAHDASKVIDDLAEAAVKCDGLCFIAGTEVLVEDGTKNIECIKTGDLVWAWDETTDTVALKEVVETYINETDELIHVFVDGQEIISTPSHPFYSPVKGWTEAVYLRAGDILVLVNGDYVVVEKVQHEILEAPVTVYNFQVEDYHTYYVSNSGILVHNSCTKKATGSYEIFTSDNRVYVGKGSIDRMNASIRRLTKNDFVVVDYYWTPSKNHLTAFVDEYMKMAKYDFDFGGKLINKIMSPGFKIFNLWL